MMTTESCHCSRELCQIFLEGMQEMMGQSGLVAALSNVRRPDRRDAAQTHLELSNELDFAEIAGLVKALEKQYGLRGGQGIVLRAGKAAFKYFLRRFGTQMRLGELEYRLLPTMQRLKTGLAALAETLSVQCGVPVEASEISESWIFRIDQCPWCLHRPSEENSVCYFIVGLLQEYFSWVSGGRYYEVREVECRAAGGVACVFQINKQPLD